MNVFLCNSLEQAFEGWDQCNEEFNCYRENLAISDCALEIKPMAFRLQRHFIQRDPRLKVRQSHGGAFVCS